MHQTKLVQPDRFRLRVHELARHVGSTPTVMLQEIRALGESVATISSKVEIPVIRRVCESHGAALPWAASLNSEPPGGESRIATDRSSSDRPPGASGRTARDNNPLMDVSASSQATHTYVEMADDVLEPAYQANGFREAIGETKPAWALGEWALRGFSESERDEWIEGGLRATQATCARQLALRGLGPEHLAESVYGYSILDRVRRGEGADGVARMYFEERNQTSSSRSA